MSRDNTSSLNSQVSLVVEDSYVLTSGQWEVRCAFSAVLVLSACVDCPADGVVAESATESRKTALRVLDIRIRPL